MHLESRKEIFDYISLKNVLIWGARMTGIGALRQLKKKNIKIINFIDSDQSLVGKSVYGYQVHHPNELKKILDINKNVVILIAVSLKESEIFTQLQKFNIKNIPVISFLDEMAPRDIHEVYASFEFSTFNAISYTPSPCFLSHSEAG